MKNNDKYHKFYQKGMEFFQKNQIKNAVDSWEQASKIKKNSADIHSILGNAYKILNDMDKSITNLGKAADLNPDNFKYLYNYGLILYEQQKYTDSLNIFLKALELKPKNYELLNDIGVVYFQLKKYNNAINSFNEAIEINPNYPEAKINLCYSYIETNDIEKSYDILNKIKTAHPNSKEIIELDSLLQIIKDYPEKQINDIETKLEFSDKTFKIKPLEFINRFYSSENLKEIELSIVIPIYNEEDNIKPLYEKLCKVLGSLKQHYEIIFIDDGSNDNSLKFMKLYAEKDRNVKIIQFRRNYGQTAALSAGFKYSHGKIVITLDGDLQNDPEDIPMLLEKMAEGYDLVNGWRKNRQDKALTRKLPSTIANKIINFLISGTGIQLNDFGCTLKAYKRGIIKNIRLYGEMHRFIPVFAAWLGVKVTEIPVRHHPRIHGKAKYNLSRVSRVIFDLLVIRFFSDYMTRPIQFFGKISKQILSYSSILLIIFSLLKFFTKWGLTYDTYFIMYSITIFSCLQIIIMGLLGEILMRSYFEGQDKDSYIVEKII